MNKYSKQLIFFSIFFTAIIFFADIPTAYARDSLIQRIKNRIVQRRESSRQRESVSGCGIQPVDVKQSILVAGIKRTYVVHVPAQYKTDCLYPIVFVLHGAGGNAENAIRMSQMNPKADKEDFIVVYPNGTGKLKNRMLRWNDGREHAPTTADDVAFFRHLILKLKKDYNIDPNRIYVTGFSNGGMMAHRLGCELSDVLAAIAPVAGSIHCDKTDLTVPLSVLIFHGTEDKYVPYDGGLGKSSGSKQRIDKSVAYAVDFWVDNNGCDPVSLKETFGSIIKESYSGGRMNTEVILYTIKGGGHSWPGGKKGIRYGNADPPTQEIYATDLIWDFFESHPKQ